MAWFNGALALIFFFLLVITANSHNAPPGPVPPPPTPFDSNYGEGYDPYNRSVFVRQFNAQAKELKIKPLLMEEVTELLPRDIQRLKPRHCGTE